MVGEGGHRVTCVREKDKLGNCQFEKEETLQEGKERAPTSADP
jgi:hypothetical protein